MPNKRMIGARAIEYEPILSSRAKRSESKPPQYDAELILYVDGQSGDISNLINEGISGVSGIQLGRVLLETRIPRRRSRYAHLGV